MRERRTSPKVTKEQYPEDPSFAGDQRQGRQKGRWRGTLTSLCFTSTYSGWSKYLPVSNAEQARASMLC